MEEEFYSYTTDSFVSFFESLFDRCDFFPKFYELRLEWGYLWFRLFYLLAYFWPLWSDSSVFNYELCFVELLICFCWFWYDSVCCSSLSISTSSYWTIFVDWLCTAVWGYPCLWLMHYFFSAETVSAFSSFSSSRLSFFFLLVLKVTGCVDAKVVYLSAYLDNWALYWVSPISLSSSFRESYLNEPWIPNSCAFFFIKSIWNESNSTFYCKNREKEPMFRSYFLS